MSNKKDTKPRGQQIQDGAAAVIWDIPLRLFHWALLAATIAAFVTSKLGIMFWHEKAGLTILGLVSFRIIWGFVGSHHARFSNFMVKPGAVIRYVKSRLGGDRLAYPGHAPTGAYATLLILAIFGVMALLGTMANDDILYEGPLAAFVGDFTNDARQYHHLMERAVIAVVALHLLAIIVYRVALKINLITAMVNGGRDKTITPPTTGHQMLGLVIMAASIAAAQSLGLLGDRFF